MLLLSALLALAGEPAPLTVASFDFNEGQAMPAVVTCEGAGRPPCLRWEGVPAGTQAFAILVDDPDAPDPAAPKTTWTHWILYDLPASTSIVPPGAPLPEGTRVGTNGWGKPEYGGPCPPIGEHHYRHQVFALDQTLGELPTPDREHLLQAMRGHVLAQGTLTGTYAKQAPAK